MAERLQILLLTWDEPVNANTIRDHIDAIAGTPDHDVCILPFATNIPAQLDLEKFDAVVIHYSIYCAHIHSLGLTSRRKIARYSGLKAVFVQDEYRTIDATVAVFAEMGIDLLFTVVPEGLVDRIYDPQKLPCRRVTVLTGYVPKALLSVKTPDISERGIDIGYRARRLPYWLGKLAQEKTTIAEKMIADAQIHGLTFDISCLETDRIYGEAWIRFLSQCKATLGTESGASLCDFAGKFQAAVDEYCESNPAADFAEVESKIFPGADGKIVIAVISPRVFEAAALRTLMILYEGSYSGRLVPWRHYVPLRKDHSNISEVVAVLRDPARIRAIVDAAYDEVACAYENSFASLRSVVFREIEAAFLRKGRPQVKNSVRQSDIDAIIRRLRMMRWLRESYRSVYLPVLGVIAAVVKGALRLLPGTLGADLERVSRRYWRIFVKHTY